MIDISTLIGVVSGTILLSTAYVVYVARYKKYLKNQR